LQVNKNHTGVIKMKNLILIISLLLVAAATISAQDIILDANLRKETIIQIAQMLEEKYVLPEIGKKYSEHLLKLLNQNDYDSVTSGIRLAEKITSDLKEVRNDLHLRVMYSPRGVKNIREAEIKSEEEKLRDRELRLRAERKRNFGAKELRILPGNIGYFRLDAFPGEAGSETLISALSFLQHSEAIILDLRNNGGGIRK